MRKNRTFMRLTHRLLLQVRCKREQETVFSDNDKDPGSAPAELQGEGTSNCTMDVP